MNCSATFLAKRRKSAHVELDEDIDVLELRAESDPEAAAGTADDRERLVQALTDLPDQMRMVVVLRDVYDLPHEEIARELGISQTAAKVRLHRARRRLREQLFATAGAPVRSRQRGKLVGSALAEAGLLEVRVLDESLAEEADRRAAAV